MWSSSRGVLRLLACLAAVAPACAKPVDPVDRLLADVAKAAESRDAPAVLEHLTPDFRGQGGLGRAEAGAELRRTFALYDSLEVLLSEVSTERDEGSARVTLRADFSGRPRQVAGLEGWLPRASTFRFELRLAPDTEGWKLSAASWQRIDGADQPR